MVTKYTLAAADMGGLMWFYEKEQEGCARLHKTKINMCAGNVVVGLRKNRDVSEIKWNLI